MKLLYLLHFKILNFTRTSKSPHCTDTHVQLPDRLVHHCYVLFSFSAHLHANMFEQYTLTFPPEVWKTRQFDDILLRHCNAVYNQNSIDRWMKGCILPFHKKGDLGLAKNYRGITLTSIAAKIYNALIRNRIEPKIDNIRRKNQNEIDPQPHKYWPSVEYLRAYGQKTYRRHYLLSTLPRPSIPFTEGRWNKSC